MNDEQLKAIKARVDGLRNTDAVQQYQEFADMVALLEHVEAQAERLRKLEAALREIVEFDPGEGDAMAFALMAGFARGRAHRALSDWTPFADVVSGVDNDTAHGG